MTEAAASTEELTIAEQPDGMKLTLSAEGRIGDGPLYRILEVDWRRSVVNLGCIDYLPTGLTATSWIDDKHEAKPVASNEEAVAYLIRTAAPILERAAAFVRSQVAP